MANSTAPIFEGSDGYALFDLYVPSFASTFIFDLSFSNSGDGDWLEVLFGNTLLGAYQGSNFGTDSNPIFLDFSGFAGQSGVLTFLLASSGSTNAALSVSNFRFVTSEVLVGAPIAPVPSPPGAVLLLSAISGMVGFSVLKRKRRKILA